MAKVSKDKIKIKGENLESIGEKHPFFIKKIIFRK